MAARLRIVAWSLTALLLSGLLAGCAQQADPAATAPLGSAASAAVLVLESTPASDDVSKQMTAGTGGHDHEHEDGAEAETDHAAAGNARSPLGRIDLRLTRETWDRPAPYPARFAAYAEFRNAAGRAVDTPKDAAWTLMFAGDGMVRSAAGRGMPAYPEFEATNPATYVATFTLQADGFRTASKSVTVEAFGARGSDLVYYDEMADMPPFTFSGAMIAYTPGQDMKYVAPNHGAWERQEGFGHLGTQSWRTNYPDSSVSNLTLPRLWLPAEGAVLEFWSRGGAESNGFDGLYVNAIDSLGNVVQLARLQDDGPNWREHRIGLPGGVQNVQFQFRADAVCGGIPMPVNGSAVGACGNGYDAQGFWIDDVKVWQV
jgi:hypothetical protein